MSDFLRAFRDSLLNPWGLTGLAIVVVFLVVRRWFHLRAHDNARAARVAALTPPAVELGGRVTGPDGATAWSAGLRGPMADEATGVPGRLFPRSRPGFDLAMDFRRGPWHVRVTEASVRTAVVAGAGARWDREHRIEVATTALPAMKLVRPPRHDHRGVPVPPREDRRSGWASRPPATATAWHPLPLPDALADDFTAFGADPAAAPFTFDGLWWILERENALPVWAREVRLTFEGGLVYAIFPHPVYPDDLLAVVDTIVGLLDRTPGVRPRPQGS
ncbi:hypothetical protein AB0A74_31955 [Saccharothrix sp. NPDC042600]|uniref:hypothetical protein n=1 Tax=Saccharothrix TaxID=2071 RepID=UPI0033E7ACA4|nr:hypothetical protein GCM10017745_40980 [Saccharothrix mutabilis subsp. capreolus]